MKTSPTNFEVSSGLHIIARQKPGTTDASKRFVKRNLRRIGEVSSIVLVNSGFCYRVYVIGCKPAAILIHSGFTWGYNGEGPKGLRWLFERIGWTVDLKTLPSSDCAGVFVISRPVAKCEVYQDPEE